MRTIAVINQKGGCGKTTVSINLASALAEKGHKTLLVDMDPQSHCAVGLAVPEDQIEQSIYDVLISKSRNEPIKITEIAWEISDRFELAPASIDLSAFEQQMAGIVDRESCLKYVLEGLDGEYEFVVIDCPPAVGLLTFNALRASTDVIVPVETGYFALHGLSKQLETLSILCKRCNQQINVKVLASMYDIRTKMAREILAELCEHFGEKMFRTVVNFNTKLKEAASLGQPICEYDPASKGYTDFLALVDEVTSLQTKQHHHELAKSLSNQLAQISSTADELLKPEKPEIKPIQAKQPPVAVANKAAGTSIIELNSKELDRKLSGYYGVRQIDEAVMFVTIYPRAESVSIAGDFNGWQPMKTPMEKVGSKGIWKSKIKLPAGKYRYRLVVDGQWQQDPYNEQSELNPFGERNSVLEVK
ncbi:MAG: AAA family ATPase [Planctomycetota bacterium]